MRDEATSTSTRPVPGLVPGRLPSLSPGLSVGLSAGLSLGIVGGALVALGACDSPGSGGNGYVGPGPGTISDGGPIWGDALTDAWTPDWDGVPLTDALVDGAGPADVPTSFDLGSNKTACSTDADCPAEAPHCGLSGFCFECLTDADCPDGVCTNGNCAAKTCAPGEKKCSGTTLLTCNTDGTDWDSFPCPGADAACTDGQCTGCPPKLSKCVSKTEVVVCKDDGSGFTPPTTCPAGFCADGQCLDCYPGTKRCTESTVETCSTGGQWEPTEDCAALGKACVEGACQSPCGEGGKLSNEGCDYWAVDMDNLFDAADSPHAVVASNLSETASTVTITVKTGPTATATQVLQKQIPAGGLEVFELPQQNMADTGLFWNAYRVTSTTPIVAYQFNPLDNIDVYSNDASLLLPINTFGTEYFVVSRFEFIGGGPDIPPGKTCLQVCGALPGGKCQEEPDPNDIFGIATIEVCVVPYRGTVSSVTAAPGTTVTIEPTVKTLAGGGVAAMSPGHTYTYALEPYQVLNIQSDEAGELGDADLTGTIITADKPIGVFSGHQGAIGDDECCADHLEQQLFPTNTWGKKYVAAKSMPRGIEKDYWRIVASKDMTQVSFTPAVHGTVSLSRGEHFELASDKDFVISANQPVLVAQTLPSSYEIIDPGLYASCLWDSDCHPGYTCFPTYNICVPPDCSAGKSCPGGHTCECYPDELGLGESCQCEAIGDPALILSAPIEQFRDRYVFLSPLNYLQDYINVVAPTGATVKLDGATVSASKFTAITGTDWLVARLPVADGTHKVEADQPVGIVAYGYDNDVSYGYTAGLSLSDL